MQLIFIFLNFSHLFLYFHSHSFEIRVCLLSYVFFSGTKIFGTFGIRTRKIIFICLSRYVLARGLDVTLFGKME